MSIEAVFDEKFEQAMAMAHKTHRKTAFFTGTAYSVGQAMNVTAEGVMLYVASIFVASGRYTFAQMLQVFTLIMFSVTFAAQTMSYVPALSRASAAAHDLLKLYELSEDTEESQGKQTYHPVQGSIAFDQINFSYPSRKEVKALDGLSFFIKAGETVGVVG
jgi:ATP-binding cassette subfamily B (MDR/TAP) protein 1